MEPRYTVGLAQPEHVPALPGVELAAATLLTGHAPASILAESTPLEDLALAQQEGRLWVALADEVPVGFAIVKMLAEDLPHLHEIDVCPPHGRRGVGTALLRAVLAWVARGGYSQLTLTTFRDVPWNMPFYARLGWTELPRDGLRPELQAIVEDETRRGLAPAARVVMSYSASG